MSHAPRPSQSQARNPRVVAGVRRFRIRQAMHLIYTARGQDLAQKTVFADAPQPKLPSRTPASMDSQLVGE